MVNGLHLNGLHLNGFAWSARSLKRSPLCVCIQHLLLGDDIRSSEGGTGQMAPDSIV